MCWAYPAYAVCEGGYRREAAWLKLVVVKVEEFEGEENRSEVGWGRWRWAKDMSDQMSCLHHWGDTANRP